MQDRVGELAPMEAIVIQEGASFKKTGPRGAGASRRHGPASARNREGKATKPALPQQAVGEHIERVLGSPRNIRGAAMKR